MSGMLESCGIGNCWVFLVKRFASIVGIFILEESSNEVITTFLLLFSLRFHPHFKKIVASRLQHNDINTLAKVLSDSSTGRQQ